jgi:hypothetical protein
MRCTRTCVKRMRCPWQKSSSKSGGFGLLAAQRLTVKVLCAVSFTAKRSLIGMVFYLGLFSSTEIRLRLLIYTLRKTILNIRNLNTEHTV